MANETFRITSLDDFGEWLIFYLIDEYPNDTKIVAHALDKMINNKQELGVVNKQGKTIFKFAVERVSLEVLATILAKNIPIPATGKDLFKLTSPNRNQEQDVKLAQMLLNKGIKPGNDSLTAAVKRNNPELIKLLVENGADINEKNSDGTTPLTEALKNDKTQIPIDLIQLGADTKATDAQSNSAESLINKKASLKNEISLFLEEKHLENSLIKLATLLTVLTITL